MTLGIYIPTYNRENELRRQLESIIRQAGENVHIYVADNCSSTYSVEELKNDYSHPRLEFHRNACNIGGNANIALGFPLMGHHTYLWILGDSDILVDNAVSIVLEYLKNEPDMLIFNQTEKDMVVVEPGLEGWNPRAAGLISQGIYKSEVFLPYAINAYLYHNCSFPHLAIYFAAKNDRSLRVAYSRTVIFQENVRSGGQVGNYDLSVAGMPLLSNLFPASYRKVFLKNWLNDMGQRFFDLKNAELEFVRNNTKLILRRNCYWRYCLAYIRNVFLRPIMKEIRSSLVIRKTIEIIKINKKRKLH